MSPHAVRHLRPRDYRVMPWRNGGGTTTELIIEPADASLEKGFLWRLSTAEVGASGPFSRFDGYDRTLLLLEGRGLLLEFDQRPPTRLEHPLESVAFSGDWATSGTLLDGPCRDFNIITRRAHCSHHLEILNLEARPAPIPQARIRFIFCVSGKARVGRDDLAPMELLRVEGGPERLEATALEASGAVLFAIGIDPAGGERW